MSAVAGFMGILFFVSLIANVALWTTTSTCHDAVSSLSAKLDAYLDAEKEDRAGRLQEAAEEQRRMQHLLGDWPTRDPLPPSLPPPVGWEPGNPTRLP